MSLRGMKYRCGIGNVYEQLLAGCGKGACSIGEWESWGFVCYGLVLKTDGFLNDRVVAKECVVCSEVGLKDSTNDAAQSRRSLQRQSTEVWRKECDGRPG